jgi:hypothetical protein
MARFIDRICEHSPRLADALLGAEPGSNGPPPGPVVVVVADHVLTRAVTLVTGPSAPPTNYAPPWPLTLVEFGPSRDLPDVLGDLRAPTAMGWLLRKEGDVGLGPQRLHATSVVEGGVTSVGPLAEPGQNPAGRAVGQPGTRFFAAGSDGQSGVSPRVDAALVCLRLAIHGLEAGRRRRRVPRPLPAVARGGRGADGPGAASVIPQLRPGSRHRQSGDPAGRSRLADRGPGSVAVRSGATPPTS